MVRLHQRLARASTWLLIAALGVSAPFVSAGLTAAACEQICADAHCPMHARDRAPASSNEAHCATQDASRITFRLAQQRTSTLPRTFASQPLPQFPAAMTPGRPRPTNLAFPPDFPPPRA